MYCLDAKDGTQLWFAPKMRQFIVAQSRRASMPAMSWADWWPWTPHREPGSARCRCDGITLKLTNSHSDRVYLANDSCVMQCLAGHRRASRRRSTCRPPAEPEADKPKAEVAGRRDRRRIRPLKPDADADESQTTRQCPTRTPTRPPAMRTIRSNSRCSYSARLSPTLRARGAGELTPAPQIHKPRKWRAPVDAFPVRWSPCTQSAPASVFSIW